VESVSQLNLGIPVGVLTLLLNGGLNQIMLRCLFLRIRRDAIKWSILKDAISYTGGIKTLQFMFGRKILHFERHKQRQFTQ
jgi:hypothetical protein